MSSEFFVFVGDQRVGRSLFPSSAWTQVFYNCRNSIISGNNACYCLELHKCTVTVATLWFRCHHCSYCALTHYYLRSLFKGHTRSEFTTFCLIKLKIIYDDCRRTHTQSDLASKHATILPNVVCLCHDACPLLTRQKSLRSSVYTLLFKHYSWCIKLNVINQPGYNTIESWCC